SSLRRHGAPRQAPANFASKIEDSQVVRRQPDHQLVITLDLAGYIFVFVEIRQTKVTAEKTVGSLAVIKLIIVVRGVAVLMPLEVFLLAVKSEESPRAVEDQRLYRR